MKKDKIYAKLKKFQVSQATSIVKEYILTSGSFTATSRPDRGQVALVLKDDYIHIFLTEDGISSSCPPLELVSFFADMCNITDGSCRALLQTTLSVSSHKKLQEIYYREGYLTREDLQNDGSKP